MKLPFSDDTKRRTLFRVLSIMLAVASILFFFYGKKDYNWMGFYSLLTAVLFLLCYCGWIPKFTMPWLLAVPCIPMIIYDFDRVYLFIVGMVRAGTATKYDIWYTLEVLLLALTYLLFVILVLMKFKSKGLKITVLILCAVCVLLGIWDIFDGTWVLFNPDRFNTDVARHFFFYYVPDIIFWICPFLMLGSVAAREKL